jgi:ATP adenylyltransferase
VISRTWQPQAGWLEPADWHAVSELASDCGGLWFFNSCAAAGASQPHRHLQLLPRRQQESSCPLAPLLLAQLERPEVQARWPWTYALSRRQDPHDPDELAALYLAHAEQLGLGRPQRHPQPLHPYNLLFDDDWLMTVRRRREHWAGFSLNALAFAGYLLATEHSQQDWLEAHGPWALLQQAAWCEGSGSAANP